MKDNFTMPKNAYFLITYNYSICNPFTNRQAESSIILRVRISEPFETQPFSVPGRLDWSMRQSMSER